MGMELVCSPKGFFFRIGDFFAGSGFTVGLLLLVGSGSTSFSSGWPVLVLLEDAPPFLPTVRLLILFQRARSILVGGLGWWLIRLYQGLESSGGGSGGLGFDFASGAQPSISESELLRKTNKIPRSLFVIFLFFGALFVKGDALCCFFRNWNFYSDIYIRYAPNHSLLQSQPPADWERAFKN